MKKRLLSLLYTPIMWIILVVYAIIVVGYFVLIGVMYPIMAISGEVDPYKMFFKRKDKNEAN